MKTTIAIAALMVLMTAARINAMPDSTRTKISNEVAFQAAVNARAGNVIEFRVAKPTGEKVVLMIYAKDNNKVYQRTLHTDKPVELNCDMKDFGKGTYTCVIERNGQEVVRKAVTLK